MTLSQPFATSHERTPGEVGVLLGEEPTDEIVGDVELGGGHVLRRHQIDVTRSVGFELGEVQQALIVGEDLDRLLVRQAHARAAGSASGCAGCTRRA